MIATTKALPLTETAIKGRFGSAAVVSATVAASGAVRFVGECNRGRRDSTVDNSPPDRPSYQTERCKFVWHRRAFDTLSEQALLAPHYYVVYIAPW
jgi:hypothetical protein